MRLKGIPQKVFPFSGGSWGGWWLPEPLDGNEIPIDIEGGILTAKDTSGMDLRGSDLMIISACQSGLGEVTDDGVFGLRRGFKKTGVHSVVMSPRDVDDDATS